MSSYEQDQALENRFSNLEPVKSKKQPARQEEDDEEEELRKLQAEMQISM